MRRWLAVLPMVAVLAAPAARAAAAPLLGASALAGGAVVSLKGTSHLWFAGADGTLHWAGDTRALAGRDVQWGNRTEVTLDELKAMPRGDPWLSAGLLKLSDPIYFVKWESDWAEPQLLHIQSIADVELFGINGSNYGQLVLDEAPWKQRFGIAPGGLNKGVLAPAAMTSPVAAAPAAPGPTLSRAPTAGPSGDVTFFPQNTLYEANASISAAATLLGTINGETFIGRWVTKNAGANPMYLLVSAVNLQYDRDVKTLEDFAKRKLDVVCRTSSCELQPLQPTTVGGLPALRADYRERHTLPTPTGERVPFMTENFNRQVFLISGNYGVAFRAVASSADVFNSRVGDLDAALAAVRFQF
jgi:hypothetical protein